MAGGDRNQTETLRSRVRALQSLRVQLGIGDVWLHTRLIFDGAALASCGPICNDLVPGGAIDGREAAKWLMTELATAGSGTGVDPGAPENLTLADLDTSELTNFCP